MFNSNIESPIPDAAWRAALAERLKAAEEAARTAAAAVWALRDRFVAAEKRPDDWVTDADREADRLIRDVKDRRFPDDGWLSEESLTGTSAGAFTWVVDPIDGTREFVAGNPEHAVSIGLVWRGSAVGGVIAHPPSGTVMSGSVEEGLRPIPTTSLSARRDLHAGPRILVSRSDTAQSRFTGWPADVPITPVGSIAYKLALLAYGECDAVVSLTGKRPWDVMGGFALLRAAGLTPRFLDGRDHPMPADNRRLPGFVVAREAPLADRLFSAAQQQARSLEKHGTASRMPHSRKSPP